MTKGIFLIAHGKRGYIYATYNLALSIKFFDPEIKICLLHDESIDLLPDKKFFDILIPFKPESDPGEIKTQIYDYLPFDYNLYLDVDSIALSSVSKVLDELIEKGGYYYTHVSGLCTEYDKDFPELIWCSPKQIWEKYNLGKTILSSVNSSFQFIKKCKESKELFEQIVKNINDPIPLSEHNKSWGGTQPDEIYIGAALAQKGITGQCKEYVYFSSKVQSMEFQEIEEKFPLLTLYGGKGYIRLSYIEWYDRLMHKYTRQFGLQHEFKTRYILPDKHVNK